MATLRFPYVCIRLLALNYQRASGRTGNVYRGTASRYTVQLWNFCEAFPHQTLTRVAVRPRRVRGHRSATPLRRRLMRPRPLVWRLGRAAARQSTAPLPDTTILAPDATQEATP